MMIHSLVIVPAPAQRRWFWPSATWCQVSWQRFEVRVPFVMLKNNVVLIVPCFEHHQSEYMLLSCHHTHSPQTFLCPSAFIVLLIMTSLTAKKRAISHSNAPKTVPTLHFYPKKHVMKSWNHEVSVISKTFLQEFTGKITRSNRGNRLIQIASLARSDLERYKRVERKSLGPAKKMAVSSKSDRWHDDFW